MIGWHVEVVSPGVFSAIQAWYCGGPRITRSVIATDPGGSGKSTGTELELFPLRLVVCTCDERGSTVEQPQQGNPINTNNNNNVISRPSVREVLVSKAATVGDLLRHLVRLDHDQGQGQRSGGGGNRPGTAQGTLSYINAAASVILPSAYDIANANADSNPLSSGDKVSGLGVVEGPVDISHVRLWNYAPLHWKHQFVLGQELGQPSDHVAIDELTLEAARLQDGQRVLLERRLPDGSWPRQRLQEAFEQQQQQQQQQVAVNDAETATSASSSMKIAGNSSVDNNNEVAAAGMTSSLSSPALLATAAAAGSDATLALSQWQGRRVNEGKVGLENLGNTCYLNSSVQVNIAFNHILTRIF